MASRRHVVGGAVLLDGTGTGTSSLVPAASGSGAVVACLVSAPRAPFLAPCGSEAPPLCLLACRPEEIWQNQRPTGLGDGDAGRDEDMVYVDLLRLATTTIELMLRAMAVGTVRGSRDRFSRTLGMVNWNFFFEGKDWCIG